VILSARNEAWRHLSTVVSRTATLSVAKAIAERLFPRIFSGGPEDAIGFA
jgi:hypothetical protein